ncbi:hypothetical protein NOK12_35860 [Nocardioides sp. OK12]|nr:hypothetical protein NOK12_35860 [Nocardioides sp. OK12]
MASLSPSTTSPASSAKPSGISAPTEAGSTGSGLAGGSAQGSAAKTHIDDTTYAESSRTCSTVRSTTAGSPAPPKLALS